jgi:FAD/FMN-containing dehydrogenase
MIVTSTEFTGVDGDLIQVSESQIEALQRQINGRVVRNGQPGWDEALLTWNAMWTARPALVVQPSTSGDVSTVVTFARDLGLLVSIKGGGHNIAGTAIADGGIMIDLSAMREVVVDPVGRIARAGGGCLLGDVDQATQEYGLATVLGLVSDVGIGGLTLGGGFGNLSRRFGWSVDNLESVEIVTADGQIRTASRDLHPDLFWAVRGGGGNFGVVTRFDFRLHPVGPMVYGGLRIWPMGMAPQVVAAYRELVDRAPRELMSGMVFTSAPAAPFVPEAFHHKPVVGMLICHSGANPERDLAALKSAPPPALDLVADRPYVEQQMILNDMEPKGFNQYWKAEYLPGISPEYLETSLECSRGKLSPHSYTITLHLGGAIKDRDWDDGAVGNRDAEFIGGVASMWEEDGRDAEHIAWARDTWNRIRPFSTGGNYVNFQMPDDDEKRTAASYGTNITRLQAVKSAYDPHNFFRVNRNISPVSAG